ncbi:MAG: glycosyltransferase [Candidatus Aenigmarchaeota archaeon]|nr:glycosyltransferase [Candidatus Aenigmarchaeota archaeon]
MFTDTYDPQTNGAVDSIKKFTKELRKRGHKVYIFCPYDKKLKKNKYIIPLRSVKFLPYPEYRIGLPSARIIKHIKKIRPDVIHIQSPATIGLAGLAIAKYYNIPTVATYHTLLTEYFSYISTSHEKMSKKSIIKFTKWFFSKVDKIIVPSTSIIKILKRYGIHKPMEVIMTGIYLKKRMLKKKHKNEIPLILHVGRICKEKRIDVIIKAFKKILKQRDAKLVITSDGPDRERLEKLVDTLKIADKVLFTGYISDTKRDQYYKDADVFVTASKTETQGIVLAEALSIGCPVVVKNSLGFKDVIKNGYNGFLFNNEKGMIKSIFKVLDDASLRKKFVKNAKETVNELSVEKTSDKLIDSYNNLLYSEKISVIIPTYREEKYIKKTLESVRKQTYPNYEIIVVDGNSPDATRKIARKYADKVINLRERGVAKARNVGTKVATGDIFVFLDGDTIIEKNFIKKIVNLFRNKNISGVFPQGRTRGKKSQVIFDLQNIGVAISTFFRFPMLPGTCVIYRRSFFEKTKGFIEGYVTAEDIIFSLKNRKYGKLIYSNKVSFETSNRRVRGNRSTGTIVFWIKNIPKSLFGTPSEKYEPVR